MGSFCVVRGDVGILLELSRSWSSASGAEVCCGSCFAWCVQCWKRFAPLSGYCTSEATIPSCGSYMSMAS